MKRLIILICVLALLTAGNVYAQDVKGEDMPGGEFSLGEYGPGTYINGWMGLRFTAGDKYLALKFSDRELTFFQTDEESLRRLDMQFFETAWAFSYAGGEKLDRGVDLYVRSLRVQLDDLGYISDRDDYIAKFIAYTIKNNQISKAEFSDVYDAVLGGRNFKAFDLMIMGKLEKRYYIQQLGKLLVVVEMTAIGKDNREEALDEMAACFTKYN